MASIALISWPFVALVLFAQLPLRSALVWSILLAYLLLPEGAGFNLPLVPPLDKESIPAYSLILAVLLFGQSASPRAAPLKNATAFVDRSQGINLMFRLLMAGFILSPVLTVLGNTDAVVIGDRFLPGLKPWDMISMTAQNVVLLVPFFLARRHLATPDAHNFLLRALLIAGLAYSLLILVEVRLSPQLNKWLYGYYQHSFAQHVRNGGYRPMVFLGHGLSVGFFVFSVVIAAFGLYRAIKAKGNRDNQATRLLLAGLWMLGILLISKNLGATVLALLLVPALLWLGRRGQVRLVAVVAILFALYPAVRQAGLAPTDSVVALAEKISVQRAQSFQFRLDNEDQLLDRALQKPLAGWGGWGRNRVYSDAGNDIAVTDGIWVIVIGTSGWIGYITFFGLLLLPVILLPRIARHRPIPIETVALAIIMTGNFLYMIPNATLSPIGWLMAGALAGFVQFGRVEEAGPDMADAPESPRELRYTRFGDGKRAGPVTARSHSV